MRFPDAAPGSVLEMALALAREGCYVGPLAPGGKHAGSRLGEGWPSKTSRDSDDIAAWFAGSSDSLMLHVGRSGLIAFDVDDPAQVPDWMWPHLDEAVFQGTSREVEDRGHYLFRLPDGVMYGNGLGSLPRGWGEVRGQNGVIVMAPSPHSKPTGEYRIVRGGEPPLLPDQIAKHLTARSGDGGGAASDSMVRSFLEMVDEWGVGDERGRGLLDRTLRKAAREAAAGSRHDVARDHLVWAFKDAAAGLYPAQVAVDAYREWWTELWSRKRRGEARSEPDRGEFAGLVAWAVGCAMAATDDELRERREKYDPSPPVVPDAVGRDRVVEVFRTWFGPHYDTQYLMVVLAVAAAGLHLEGDPCWLQIIGGSGAGKTETVAALRGAQAHIVSSLSGEAALLSGSSQREQAEDATGGLLREIGDEGLLVIKDFTSILSAHRDRRSEVLAALREVYDGTWTRTLGVDGGRSLTWQGRLAVLSCVTGVYDEHHAVIAAMGERFLLLRVDSDSEEVRRFATRQAIRNNGTEDQMRSQLAEAVGGFLLHLEADQLTVAIPDGVEDYVADLADLMARARSQVARDGRGEPEFPHAPEMPTRLAKQLIQLFKGARLVGMSARDALQMLARVGHDTVPPNRRKALLAVHDTAGDRTSKGIAQVMGVSRQTADRTLRELQMHGLVRCDDTAVGAWRWWPTRDIDVAVLRPGYGNGDEAVA